MARQLSNPVVLAALGIVLVALATLEYRWIGEISAAERERLERGLETSARLFRNDFNQELHRTAAAFLVDPRDPNEVRPQVLTRLEEWRASGGGLPALEAIYLQTVDEQGAEVVERLDPESSRFVSAKLPEELRRPGPPQDRRGGRRGGPGPGGPGRPGYWSFVDRAHALATTLVRVEASDGERRGRVEPYGVLYLVLDLEQLRETVFPSLEGRYFGPSGGEGRQLSIVAPRAGGAVIYRGGAADEAGDAVRPAIKMPLIWSREESGREWMERMRGRFGRRPPGGEGPDGGGRYRPPEEGRPPWVGRGDGAGRGRRSSVSNASAAFTSVAVGGQGPGWLLTVGYEAGSLDDVVARTRRRNLAVSFGVLMLLGVGMGAVVLSTRRAQRLAEMQMEFVAGVSHELRTPLAVIRSAGENLAEGVVSSPEQVREYGALVRDEGRRLSEMVEDTLELAAAQAGRRRTRIEVVSAAELIGDAVDEATREAVAAGFTVDVELPEEGPQVRVDSKAVRLSLRNLIQNAVKYGGEERWIGVRAETTDDAVTVTVSDHGHGVSAEDEAQIFEPFYRGKRAVDEQIRGAGLGLSLAKDAVESFGGGLTLDSKPGRGSDFIVRLPRVRGESK